MIFLLLMLCFIGVDVDMGQVLPQQLAEKLHTLILLNEWITTRFPTVCAAEVIDIRVPICNQ
jgi:hypothetical protein